MLSFGAQEADLMLRGAVAGVLLLHIAVLALPGPRPGARLLLAGFAASLVGYLFTQRASLLLSLPRVPVVVLLALAVTGTAWFWASMRAVFDDAARPGPALVAIAGMLALGLAGNLPFLPDAPGPYRSFPLLSWPVALNVLHALAMLGFSGAALFEVLRGWRADLVEQRRAARRWVGLAIALYGAVALAVELALRGTDPGPLLPALHVAGIGSIALALAVLMVRRSLDDVLGTAAPTAAPPRAPAPPGLAKLEQAMAVQRLYRRDGLTLAALALELGLGEAALRALINQHLGFRNFNDFLHHHRLNEAEARLVSEDLPVLSIALDCGYGSIGPFNRAFKARHGVTPTAWRAAARLRPAA